MDARVTSKPSDGFRELLRRARRAAGLSQEELAERAGISARAISDLERGVNRVPRRDTLEMLADALDLDAGQRRHWEQVRRANVARVVPADHTAEQPFSTLPVPVTPMIGREREAADLHALLSANRLVTVVGPGGVGKTRLALAVTRQEQLDNPAGVRFVSLAAIRDPQLVVLEIAHALGLEERGNMPAGDLLASGLSGRRFLLTLDNLEQVLDAAADLASLLERCPDLTMLATSRVPLRIRGEHLYSLAPLPLPGSQRLHDAASLARYHASALFIERAKQAMPEFSLDDESAQAVAEICQRLDGLPLAIELAAARCRVLSPRALLDRMQRPLGLLSGGPRDLPDRQRTMRATIDWSHDLLEPDEQRLLRWLSVFSGGWTLEAAEAVTDGVFDPAADILDMLMALVDSSLVIRQAGSGQQARFTMLETIREYGLQQLEQSGEAETAQQRHAEHFVQLVISGEEGVFQRPAETSAWYQRYRAEHDNIRSTLFWLQQTEQAEPALLMFGAANPFWVDSGFVTEGRRWVESFLGMSETVSAKARMQGLLCSGVMAALQGDHEIAEERLMESMRLAEVNGETVGSINATMFLGIIAATEQEYALARERFEQVLAMSREARYQRGITLALSNLGGIAGRERDVNRAIRLFEEAVQHARDSHDDLFVGGALANLGRMYLELGDCHQALGYFRDALDSDREGRRVLAVVSNATGFARALMACGHTEASIWFLGAIRSIIDSGHLTLTSLESPELDALSAEARATLGEESAAAQAKGYGMSIKELITRAVEDEY